MDVPDNPAQANSARIRAADTNRDRIADRLREALAEGRLTTDEHAERLDAVYRARTYADLEPLVADLPAAGGAPVVSGHSAPPLRADPPAPLSASPSVTAVLAGAERKGRWLVEARTNVVTVLGGVELDLRQAVLSQREVTINISAILGGVDITVPPGVRIVNEVAAVLGSCSMPPEDSIAPDAPVIRLTGLALLGGIDVKRREAGATAAGRWSAAGEPRRRRREIHREFRRKQRELQREFRTEQRELRRRRQA